ncbi:MAG TPA: gamma-glutamyltransferase family protein [Thermoanaerobaculia bacterium]|nr:gamma-glutamyltransferase family protein [Thermoanaerobaculia bacterium]
MPHRTPRHLRLLPLVVAVFAAAAPTGARTNKPPLHAQEWLAITGKPLAATAGSMTFQRGGNAVDAAVAMLAATCTLWDTLGWGGETQALIWHPGEERVIAVNALGVAPTGATPELFRERGLSYPPEHGPLAAVTPGTPGGLMVMLAEYGRLSLAEVLEPAIRLAEGFPIEAQLIGRITAEREVIERWQASRDVFLPGGEPPKPGQLFRQPALAATLRKLVEAESRALAAGASREAAIEAAYDRFYRGDLARDLVAATREAGGLFTLEDLAGWEVKLEEPVRTTYDGIEVYKLTTWTQGPAMLQALNILEPLDLAAMGYNSARYVHALYQAMNLAFADRDFYYGDPAFPPAEPVAGLLSKEYAASRRQEIDWDRNDPTVAPGDPYPFEGGENPFRDLLERWGTGEGDREQAAAERDAAFRAGTTTIVAADAEGWVVSATPSGGWVPAFVAGETGIGLSQRMQSFVLDPAENPFNVVAPGKRPRVTLTPSLAVRDGKPWLAFAVQGGDTQDQNLLQFFLAVHEFGMTVQEAAEAPNVTSYQMRSSFGDHRTEPGRLVVRADTPAWVRQELARMGYRVETAERTSGPINAILIDHENGTLWGGSSDHGEDYGIGW